MQDAFHLSRRSSHMFLWGSLIVAFYLFFTLPAHPQWEGSVGFLFQNPLGMALNFITLVTMGLYALHHVIVPNAPKYRSYFVAAAFFTGLIAEGLYDRALSNTPHYFATSGGAQFVSFAVIAYCTYRLVECLPPKPRSWAALTFAGVLAFFILREGYVAAQILSVCAPETAFTIWGQIFMNCA